MTASLMTPRNSPARPVPTACAFSGLCDALSQDDLLTSHERALANRLKSDVRRSEFVAGRVLAKHAVTELIGDESSRHIEILSEDTSKSSSRPIVWCEGRRVSCCVSISHCDGQVIAAAASQPIGVDLVKVGSVSSSLQRLWFTETERQHVHNSTHADFEAARIWSMKEAAFKALDLNPVFQPREWIAELTDTPRIHFAGAFRRLQFQFITLTESMILTVAHSHGITAEISLRAFEAQGTDS